MPTGNQQPRGKTERWWKKSSADVADAVFANVKHLDDVQAGVRLSNINNLRLYSNRQAAGFMGAEYAAAADGGSVIKMNVVKSCVDTAVAHIATMRPRPLYQTKGGDFETRERARRLGKFQLGQFLHMRRYIKGLQIFRDALIFGPGIEKFYGLDGRICSERVFPDELIHDLNEASGGSVRQLFQHKHIAREVLTEQFPACWKEIEGAETIRDERGIDLGLNQPASVLEAWHLPSGPDADDGRHVIAISNKTLHDEPWERDRFPFAFFNWSDPVRGLFGIGAAEELAPIQREINYIAQKIQRLMTLATSFVWKEKGSGVGRIINKDFAQYEYSGKPPIFQTVASVSAEYFNHLDRLYQRAFEIMGISQLAAQSTKPAGLDSGEALRVYNDIGTKRFQHVGQRWEQFHLDAAECIYDVASDIVAEGKNVSVLVADDKDVEEIDFKRAYIDRDKYVMQPHPASLMPDTPAGKVEMIVKLGPAIPEMQPYLAMLLTGIPDVEAVVDRMTAPIRLAEMQVSHIISNGEFEPPYESMDLPLTRNIATKALLQSYIDGVPEERCDMLRRYISHVDLLLEKNEAGQIALAQMAQPGGQPQIGGATPTLMAPPQQPPPALPMGPAAA